MNGTNIRIDVECNDVLKCAGDVLALKHAQELYGVDAIVVGRLESQGIMSEDELPLPSASRIFLTNGAISATTVLFVGTKAIWQFGYQEIRDFARRALATLSEVKPDTQTLLVTLQGAGFGFDEIEAFESEVAGFVDAIQSGKYPTSLRSIKVIEHNAGRAKRLQTTLGELLQNNIIPSSTSDASIQISDRSVDRLRSVG